MKVLLLYSVFVGHYWRTYKQEELIAGAHQYVRHDLKLSAVLIFFVGFCPTTQLNSESFVPLCL